MKQYLSIIIMVLISVCPADSAAKINNDTSSENPLMLKFLTEIPIQQRKVEFPLRSNSCIGATPIRLDLNSDGKNDATRWLVVNCAWVSFDPENYPPSLESFLIRDSDFNVKRENPLPGKIGRIFGPTVVHLDRNEDGLIDKSYVFAGHFDPDCQMMWEIDNDGTAKTLDALNKHTPENEGPHGIAFARIDRDRDGIPEFTRVFYTGELTHRCTAYEIDDRTRQSRVLCYFSEGDCCRTILAQRLDLNGDGYTETTRLYVSIIDLLDTDFGAVKVIDLPDDSDIALYQTRIPGVLGWPEKKDQRIYRATGTAAIRLDLNKDGRLETTRYFTGSQRQGTAIVGVFDVNEQTCDQKHVTNLVVENSSGVIGNVVIRIDSDNDGNADLTRIFASLVNRIAVFDLKDDGNFVLREIVKLYDYSMVYSISPLCVDTNYNGAVDKVYLVLADTWANRLAVYQHIWASDETIIAANPPTVIMSNGYELRFASDQTPWSGGLYNYSNYEYLAVYHIQIAKDKEFRNIIHEDKLDPSQPVSEQPRWEGVTYDVSKGKVVSAYSIESPAVYSIRGLNIEKECYWRVRRCDPIAHTGYSSWAIAKIQ